MALAVFLCSVPAAFARGSKIATVQIQKAVLSTDDGKKAVADLEARFKLRRFELDRREEELDELRKRLRDETLGDETRAAVQRDLTDKSKALARTHDDFQAEIEREQKRILQELASKMNRVIDSYARKKRLAVVVDVGNQETPVIWMNTGIDITDAVVKLYASMYPSVSQSTASK